MRKTPTTTPITFPILSPPFEILVWAISALVRALSGTSVTILGLRSAIRVTSFSISATQAAIWSSDGRLDIGRFRTNMSPSGVSEPLSTHSATWS